MNKRRPYAETRWQVALLILIVILAAVACGPSQVAFDVQRLATDVRTGASTASLTSITTTALRPLPVGHLVTTDTAGEAMLQGKLQSNQTCRIYIFQLTSLQMKACSKSDYQGGIAVSCQEEGSAVYKECKTHVEMTPSGEVRVIGSWIEITYQPENQLTLVVVLDGVATVRPVTVLQTRQLGEPIVVSARQFVYTMPDDRLQGIAGLPARNAAPITQLPIIIDALHIQLPLERVSQLAADDKLPFADLMQSGGLLLSGGGGSLTTQPGRDVVLQGIPWADIVKRNFDQDLPVAVDIAGQQIPDARTVKYNASGARASLDQGAFKGAALTVLYQRDDRQIAAMVQDIAKSLMEMGLKVQLNALPAGQGPAAMASMIATGQPVVYLSRR